MNRPGPDNPEPYVMMGIKENSDVRISRVSVEPKSFVTGVSKVAVTET